MVSTVAPRTFPTGVWQARATRPFTSTMQLPQRPSSQPTLVPVSFSSSRSTVTSGVSGSAAVRAGPPLSVSSIMERLPPGRVAVAWAILARASPAVLALTVRARGL